MKSKKKLASDIRKYLKDYFTTDKYFKKLGDEDKLYIYSIYNRLLHIIYIQLKNPGIIPILFVHHPGTKKILDNVFDKLSEQLPMLEDIKVVVLN